MFLFESPDLLLELLFTQLSKLEPQIHPHVLPTIISLATYCRVYLLYKHPNLFCLFIALVQSFIISGLDHYTNFLTSLCLHF